MKLHEILLQKAKDAQLGHFYIIETGAPENLAHQELISFVHHFIRDYYQKVEFQKQDITHLMNHPDIFVLGNLSYEKEDKNDKFFKVEEGQVLSRFFEFKPVQGKHKFAIITEGHRINSIVANKWLKLLEEPQGQSTIFLLNPRGGQLLPTIHSRAIHLRLPVKLPHKDFSEWNELLSNLKKMTLSEFLEHYSKGEKDLTFWINELICWEAEKTDHPAPKEALMAWLKSFQEMEIFHQPGATKWSLFYSFLKERVLPRSS